LSELGIGGTGITSSGIEQLQASQELRFLSLKGLSLNSECLAHLARLPHLQTLELDQTDVTDIMLDQLSGMDQMGRITLAYTGIGDDGIRSLMALKNLHTLDLRGTRITDKGLELLAEMLPRLKNVYLGRTRVSEAGISRLRSSHPDLFVVR
jgi:hypothetical protein